MPGVLVQLFAPVTTPDPHWNPKYAALITPAVGAPTVKSTPLLTLLPTATTTFPELAPTGTLAVILEALQFTIGAVVPLKITVPWLDPKFDPSIVTNAPTTPVVGYRAVMFGDGGPFTVKSTPLLPVVPAITTTRPLVAPVGTVVAMDVSVQLVI